MRVLAASIPGLGHLLPMAPLIEAMVAAGDEVTVAAHPSVADYVERTGAQLEAVGHDEATWFDRLRERTHGAPGDGISPDRINHYFLPRLFGEIGADDMVDELLGVAREVRPDVVLFETYALAAPLVAELTGALSVQHLVGPIIDPEVLTLADDAVSPLWRSYGWSSPGHAGVYAGATVSICPPSLERFEVPCGEHLAVRPSPTPDHVPISRDRPLVYVTIGTFFSENLEVYATVLEALGDLPIDVVVTLGAGGDPDALAAPSNATVERFVPQAELLPLCSAVVHHGGGGTTFGALAHGLPQVVLAQGADNFINAEMVAGCGAGIALAPSARSAGEVRSAVREALAVPGYGVAAREVAAEIAEMPSPAEVAASLRSMAASR